MGLFQIAEQHSPEVVQALGNAWRRVVAGLGDEAFAGGARPKVLSTLQALYDEMRFGPPRAGGAMRAPGTRMIPTALPREGGRAIPDIEENVYYGPARFNAPYSGGMPYYYSPEAIERIKALHGDNGGAFSWDTIGGFAEPGAGSKFYKLWGANADNLVDEAGNPLTKAASLYTNDHLNSAANYAESVAASNLLRGAGNVLPRRFTFPERMGNPVDIPENLQGILGGATSMPAWPKIGVSKMGHGTYDAVAQLNEAGTPEAADYLLGRLALGNTLRTMARIPGLSEAAPVAEGVAALRQAAAANDMLKYTQSPAVARRAVVNARTLKDITAGKEARIDELADAYKFSFRRGGAVK